MQDWPLLRRYVDNNSESAFTVLQEKYVHLVYAACLRELNSKEMAEDATQVVFLLLAQRASRFRRESALSGWLFQTARFVSRNLQKSERRRAWRERKATEEIVYDQSQPDVRWNQLEPTLNEALATLKSLERECLLLRFFGEASYAEIGAAAGLSEEAARKRTDRAIEKLRRYFAQRGWYLSDTALAGMLTAPDLHAPATCLAAVHEIAAGKLDMSLLGSSIHQLYQGVCKAMRMTTWKIVAGIAAVAVIGIGGINLVHGQVAQQTPRPFNIKDPIVEDQAPPQLMSSGRDATRNAVIYGKLVLPDGRPAAGYLVHAQITSDGMNNMFKKDQKKYRTSGLDFPLKVQIREQESAWNTVISHSNGKLSIPVAGNIPYNVMVFDLSGHYVAAAAQDVVAKPKQVIHIAPLQLTRGAVVQGYLKLGPGKPVKGIDIAVYGPARPSSDAGVSSVETNSAGFYRIRVAPGKNHVYAMVMGQGFPQAYVKVSAGQIKTLNLSPR